VISPNQIKSFYRDQIGILSNINLNVFLFLKNYSGLGPNMYEITVDQLAGCATSQCARDLVTSYSISIQVNSSVPLDKSIVFNDVTIATMVKGPGVRSLSRILFWCQPTDPLTSFVHSAVLVCPL
jgi:hypothetical protein